MQLVSLRRRLFKPIMLTTALWGFALLYLAARAFDGDYTVVGFSDNAVRLMAHFPVYGSLALLLAKALCNQYLLAWLISTVAATGEETHQLFVPFRFSSVEDWSVHMLGITVFLLAAYLITPWWHQEIQYT